MKNKVLNTIDEFISEMNQEQSLFSGSLFTKPDVGRILFALKDRIQELQPPALVGVTAPIDDEVITNVASYVVNLANSHAESCVDSYDFSDCIEYDTDEYRGTVSVTAQVRVDGSHVARTSSIKLSDVKEELHTMLTPVITPL